MYVHVRFIEEVGHRPYALRVKLTEMILRAGHSSYHLTSSRKSVLRQKTLSANNEGFHQHGNAWKTITRNALSKINNFFNNYAFYQINLLIILIINKIRS